MEPKDTVLYWIILGIVLLLAELMVPGLVVVFLGVAALLVALLIYLGILTSWSATLSSFFILAIVLVLSLRHFFSRFASSESKVGNMDEDTDAFGMVVTIETADDSGSRGRIQFRGSSWEAESLGGPLKAGGKARLLKRENLLWIVEPVSGE